MLSGLRVDFVGGSRRGPLAYEHLGQLIYFRVNQNIRERRVIDQFGMTDASPDGRTLAGHRGDANVSIGAGVDAPDSAQLVPYARGFGATDQGSRPVTFEAGRLHLLQRQVQRVPEACAAGSE